MNRHMAVQTFIYSIVIQMETVASIKSDSIKMSLFFRFTGSNSKWRERGRNVISIIMKEILKQVAKILILQPLLLAHHIPPVAL